MAKKTKKTKKKTAKAAPARPAKKAAKKATKSPKPARAAKKAAPGRTPASSKPAPGPFEVKTGDGASALEIGQDLVAMFNRGDWKQIEDKYWSADVESIEGVGVGMGWRGQAAVGEKNADWMADHTVHGASAEGPYVGSTGFAVKFRMDVETKSTGTRDMMEEIGVYSVRDGKIVREEFMYFSPSN